VLNGRVTLGKSTHRVSTPDRTVGKSVTHDNISIRIYMGVLGSKSLRPGRDDRRARAGEESRSLRGVEREVISGWSGWFERESYAELLGRGRMSVLGRVLLHWFVVARLPAVRHTSSYITLRLERLRSLS